MKIRAFIAIGLGSICLATIASAQISISAPSVAYTEDFDSIGTSGTATIPANWKMTVAGTPSPTWSSVSNVTATTQAASTGSPTAGGRYNWGTSASDRAIGFMTSGSYASPNSIMAHYQNNTGGAITQFSLSYDVERYRINTANASIGLFYSTDGSNWTSITEGAITFATAASSYTFATPATESRSVTVTGLNIANSSSLYLRWNFNTTGSNSQGLGLDNVSLTAIPEPSTYAAIFGALALAGVVVHRRRQARR